MNGIWMSGGVVARGLANWAVLLVLTFFAGGLGARSASADEVKQLREELAKARQEIQVLREENARLKGTSVQAPGAPASPAGVVAVPVPAPGVGVAAPSGVVSASPGVAAPGTITVPAPIAEGASVTVEQLLGEYRTSTLAGDARYKGRRFRLEGTVRSFKKTFAGMSWVVELQGGDRLGLVRGTVGFPGISDFQPAQGGRVLEGRRPFKAWQKLLEIGDRFTVEGLGAGVDGAVVVLKDCRPVTEAGAPR